MVLNSLLDTKPSLSLHDKENKLNYILYTEIVELHNIILHNINSTGHQSPTQLPLLHNTPRTHVQVHEVQLGKSLVPAAIAALNETSRR